MSDIRIVLETPPIDDLPVYIAGNFNNWQADKTAYKMKLISPGLYEFRFPKKKALPNPLEYKYLRGDWDNVEIDSYGNRTPNRVIYPAQTIIRDYVPRWAFDGKSYPDHLLPKIEILNHAFKIPQLIKTRRISALLPHNYHSSNISYPVLYLQDGQNLFGKGAGYGTWGVPKKLAVMSEKGFGDIIIIAIDHGEKERIEEFTPSHSTRLGVGDGKKYASFIANTLKPFVDKKFRTKPEPNFTGIGGSSMGGLISLYTGKIYPEVFSKWMIFSPSLWVAPKLEFDIALFRSNFERRIFLYAGARESHKLVDELLLLDQKLQKIQASQPQTTYIKVQINPEGEHQEYYWGTAFPAAVEWLFFQNLQA